MNHRDKAVELLQNYIAVAMKRRLESDEAEEVAEIVDHIIAAAKNV